MRHKLLRKWLPVSAAAVPLGISLVVTLLDAIGSAQPLPAAGVAPELWALLLAMQKTLAGRSLATSFALSAFLFTLTNLAWRADDIFDIVKERPHSGITAIDGAAEVFDHLIRKMETARSRINLMYLREVPAFDDKTNAYWSETTHLFVDKKSGNLPIRRMASIDELVKLDFLLQNNSDLFTWGGKELNQIEYQLRAFPYKHLKPLRVDVIDDTAFMFTTYDSQIMVTDQAIVSGCLKYYNDTWNGLTDWTMMDTNRAEKLAKKPGRSEFGYSMRQLEVIAKVIKQILNETQLPANTGALIEPHCSDANWAAFKKLF